MPETIYSMQIYFLKDDFQDAMKKGGSRKCAGWQTSGTLRAEDNTNSVTERSQRKKQLKIDTLSNTTCYSIQMCLITQH